MRQQWRTTLYALFLAAVCAATVGSLTGCGGAPTEGRLTPVAARQDGAAGAVGATGAANADGSADRTIVDPAGAFGNSADGSAGTPPTAGPIMTPSPSPTLPAGKQLMALRGKTLEGRTFDPATLAGKPVVIWFWAPWCEICRLFAPDVNTTAQRYAGRVAFVGVGGLDPSPAALRGFVRETGVTAIPHLNDNSGALYRRYGATAQNTWVILRADGTIGYKDIVDVRDMTTELDKIVG
jgi:thiol-disulfide isomerase/thioredoxin